MALRSPRVTSPSWFRAERWPSFALCIPGTMPGWGGGEQDTSPTGAVSRSQTKHAAITVTCSAVLGRGFSPPLSGTEEETSPPCRELPSSREGE